MLELYHADMSVCAAKVRQVLAEKGLEWKGHQLNLGAGDAQQPAYLKLNPNGVVPTLVDEGEVLVESTVICEYLDDKYPDTPLKPATALERARMRLWTKQLDEGVHAATGTVSYCIAFRALHASKTAERLDAFLARIPTQERRERIGSAIKQGMEYAGFAAGIQRYAKLLADMDAALAESSWPWLAGPSFSLADIAYTPYMTRLEHLGLDEVMVKPRPRLAAWAARLKERPSYAESNAKWFNASTLKLMSAAQDAARTKVASILTADAR